MQTNVNFYLLWFFFRQEVLLWQHGGSVLPLRLLQVQARIRIQGIRQVPLIKDNKDDEDDDDDNEVEVEEGTDGRRLSPPPPPPFFPLEKSAVAILRNRICFFSLPDP